MRATRRARCKRARNGTAAWRTVGQVGILCRHDDGDAIELLGEGDAGGVDEAEPQP